MSRSLRPSLTLLLNSSTVPTRELKQALEASLIMSIQLESRKNAHNFQEKKIQFSEQTDRGLPQWLAIAETLSRATKVMCIINMTRTYINSLPSLDCAIDIRSLLALTTGRGFSLRGHGQ